MDIQHIAKDTVARTMQTSLSLRTNQSTSIFFWPAVFGCMMLVGLIAALVDDGGTIEAIALILLCIPTLLMVYVYTLKPLFNKSFR